MFRGSRGGGGGSGLEDMGQEDCGFFQRTLRLLKSMGSRGRQIKLKEEEDR